MSRRVPTMLFSIMLVGAIWAGAVRPMINSQSITLVSAAQAQAAADYPGSSLIHWWNHL